MKREETDFTLKKLISSFAEKNTDHETVEIKNDTDLLTDLLFDSMMLIQLVIKIEQTFGIEFDDSMLDFQTLTKYNELLDYIVQIPDK